MFTAYVVIALFGLATLFVITRAKASSVTVETPTEDPIIEVSTEAMNRVFDRAAGRWCSHCGQNGSHHTDRHNDFARTVLGGASEAAR